MGGTEGIVDDVVGELADVSERMLALGSAWTRDASFAVWDCGCDEIGVLRDVCVLESERRSISSSIGCWPDIWSYGSDGSGNMSCTP